MKFKTIFILFNCIIVISFLIIYFMPLFMLGWEYTSVFWAKNWFLPVIFVAVIGGLNTYFIMHWRLFRFLESEDWDSLKTYLEEQIFTKKRIRPQFIRVLINAYLVKSEARNIRKLEEYLLERKKEMISRNVMLFSIPYFLDHDSSAMCAFFSKYKDSIRGREGLWVRWGYAFSSFLGEDKETAKQYLLKLVPDVKEPVLLTLVLYLLDAFSNEDAEVKELVGRKTKEFLGSYTRAVWEKEVEKSKNDIFIVIITKLIQEAGEWLFTRGKNENL